MLINRKQLLVFVALSLLAGYFGGILSQGDVVFAEKKDDAPGVLLGNKLMLVDDTGKKRVEITAASSSGDPYMVFFDQSGKTRLDLRLMSGSPTFSFFDSGHVPRVNFFLRPDTQDPLLMIFDSNSEEAISIAQLTGVKTFIRMRSPKGKEIVELGIKTRGGKASTFFHVSE